MTIKEVSTRLCYYDLRNPNGAKEDFSEQKIKKLDLTTKARKDCYCYNCFYGRTKLAEEIIKLKCSIRSLKQPKQ
jgi:hypothetical protein